ncbi:TPA: hypothetical protein ACJG4C_005225 [Salmonella enterica subsp. diarizonae serovar 61:r:z53]
MKLAVTDIRISAFNTLCATIDVEVEHGKSIYSVCSMDVSVPLVDGRAVKDHEEDLKSKAREIITGMYKEVVSEHYSEHSIARGNGRYESFQDAVAAGESKAFKAEYGKIAINASQVKPVSPPSKDNLEERIAALEKRLSGKRTMHVNERAVELYNPDGTLAVRFGDLNQQEKRLDEQDSSDMVKAIYEASKKAAKDFLNQQEKHPREEVLDSFLKRFRLARGHFANHPFKGFQETIKHDIERMPGVLDPIPVSIEINANSVSAVLVPASSDVFRHERNDTEGSFTEVGPFNLQIQR